MKVIVGGKDLSNFIETIGFSGDENQLARKLTVSYLYAPYDPTKPQTAVHQGDRIQLYEDGTLYFDGIVVNENTKENSDKASSDAYDFAWYLKSEVLFSYKGTPGGAVRLVCEENGVPVGSVYDPGGEVEILSTGEMSISKIIKKAYEGHDVHIYMDGMTLNTEKYGDRLVKVLTGDDKISDADYKSSIENMVNRVLLLNASSDPVGEVTNDLTGYGTVQKTYKISGDEVDVMKEAEKLLKGIESSGNIEVAKGSPDLQTGRSVIIEKAGTKIRGKFIIISDTHSISDASYTVSLGLRFESVV